MSLYQRAIRVVGGVFVVYALLVATHLGEFWPFSIYPMFSQAGNQWSRSVVREMPEDMDDWSSWKAVPFSELPGETYPLVPVGVNQNDVANYVSKTETWTEKRQQGLRSMFTKSRDLQRPLLVMKVRGELTGDSVQVRAHPMLLFAPDSTHLRPDLVPQMTASAP